MYVARDLHGRDRCRDGLANDHVGTRLSRSFLAVLRGGQVGRLVRHLVRGASRPRGRRQREVCCRSF